MRHVLLPAAGASSRMRGQDKLMQEVQGAPCLRIMARRALDSAPRLLVTLPSTDHPRAATLEGLPVQILVTPDHSEGMSASLRRGAEAAGGPLMILPADMPALTAADLTACWSAFEALPQGQILRATASDGTLGHPVIFPQNMLPDFASLTGDQGAAPLLREHSAQLHLHALPNAHPYQDLDTPEDWAHWRAVAEAD